ncbi:PAS domain-containing protein [Novilysobacter selenitireducens]|uniref:histidine kinase n=1 Tax=Novilysobacter selenitireducens TaxID=2872639 RepID=A0ABS7T824_9GAMM|nr:PAS domain-containing protein [Lysobacter selenitireducens]MBZ4040008.1 PAS domain-containing protein [Lysobacter selenitireducens]
MKPSDLHQVFESLPGNFAVLAAEPGFPVVAMSRELRNFSADPDNALGRPLFELFPEAPDAPGSEATLRAAFERVIRERAPHRHEQRYDVFDPVSGAFREIYWTATNTPILDEAGEVQYILHQSEDAATERRHGSMAILDAMTEGVFTLDRQWRFSYVNPEAHRILRQEPGTLIGAVIWERFPGSDESEFGEHYRRTMAERVTSQFTAFYPGLEGWYEVTSYPAPEGISVYFRDVTARELAQHDRERMALESAQQRRLYETALNNTPDFVYIFGTDHRAIYANEALLKVWGVEDVRGKTWMDLGYEQWHADMHDRELAQVIETRAPIRGEIPFTGTNGRRVYDYIFAPVLDADGEVVAVAGTTRDVTARQAAEQIIREHAERLADADRAKDEFLATLSHELRNPLAPLKNGVEILRRTTDGNSIHAEIHSMMERQVDHLVRLVDDLMEVSRITRGKISLQLQPADLGAIVSNALDAARPVLEAGRHALHVDQPEAPVHLLADPVRLTQILANLLNNAAKYSPPGSDIRLAVRKRDDALTVSVSDTGMGMEPAEIPHLFEMFTRGDRVRTSHQGGLGIGLALSRRLAMLHGGSLDAHSEGPGRGSTFTLELPGPFVDPTERTPTAIPDELRLSLRVLVADDNRDAGSSLADALQLFGAQVHVVDDGADALEQFESLAPDVAILDIGMPRVTGYDVAQALRGRDVRVPLIALTGWGQASDRDRAIAAGFDHHLVKPVAIPALVRLLASLERGGQPVDA